MITVYLFRERNTPKGAIYADYEFPARTAQAAKAEIDFSELGGYARDADGREVYYRDKLNGQRAKRLRVSR